MTHKQTYSFALAFLGLSITLLSMCFAALFMYFGVNLFMNTGSTPAQIGGIALMVPAAWFAGLGAWVAQKTMIEQP